MRRKVDISKLMVFRNQRRRNNEAGNDEIQNVQRVKVNMDFYFVGITF